MSAVLQACLRRAWGWDISGDLESGAGGPVLQLLYLLRSFDLLSGVRGWRTGRLWLFPGGEVGADEWLKESHDSEAARLLAHLPGLVRPGSHQA